MDLDFLINLSRQLSEVKRYIPEEKEEKLNDAKEEEELDDNVKEAGEH